MTFDPETAGYLAKSAFLRSVGIGTAAGAGVGAVAGAMNSDGKTGLVERTLRGAAGGAVGGAALGALPHAWRQGQAAINHLRSLPAPAPNPAGKMTDIEKGLIGGIGGIIGGVASTGGNNQ